jgi:3-dehydro-L-gulonate 2-dehydrogenase
LPEIRIPFDELELGLRVVLERVGLRGKRCERCARLFAETTRDGVYTHGLNRFPRFLEMVGNGSVDLAAEPVKVAGMGGLERWDGRLGVGNLNAWAAMERAIALARMHGIGGVALRNTNHWMRGGSYGWQAAEAGAFAMCWTNTMPNLPAWGTKSAVLGNNPLVIAVPRGTGVTGPHVVLDMAMSQFSYGTLAAYAGRGQALPVAGGYDEAGELTRDAAAIERTQRALPVGFWKGSGLSMVLDMMAAMLSGGRATHDQSTEQARESGVSQIFLAIDPSGVGGAEMERIAAGIVASLRAAEPVEAGKIARYPGEETLRVREENLRLGVPVDRVVWERVLRMASPE